MISCYLWFFGNLWNVLFLGGFWISQDLAKWWTTEVAQGNLAPRYIICHPKLPQSRLESDKLALKCNYQNLQACNSLHRHRTSVSIYLYFFSFSRYLLYSVDWKTHIQTCKYWLSFIYTINCHTIYTSFKNSKDWEMLSSK